jgi:hypothetical protein
MTLAESLHSRLRCDLPTMPIDEWLSDMGVTSLTFDDGSTLSVNEEGLITSTSVGMTYD